MIRLSPTTSPYWSIAKCGHAYIVSLKPKGPRHAAASLAAARAFAVQSHPEYPVRLSPACVREKQKGGGR